jgi:hypothetical protein
VSWKAAAPWLLLLAPAAAQQPDAPIARAIARLHQGDPLALAELRRDAAASCAALLADLDRAVAVQAWEGVGRTVDAIGALGRLDDRVLARLDAAIAPAPDRIRIRILRVIGDLAPCAADPELLEQWVTRVPSEAALDRIAASIWGSSRRFVSPTEFGRTRIRIQESIGTRSDSFERRLRHVNLDVAELAAEELRLRPAQARALLHELVELMRADADAINIVFDAIDKGAAVQERPPVGALRHESRTAPLAAALAIVQVASGTDEAREAHSVILRLGRPDQQRDSLIALRESTGARRTIAMLVAPLLGERHHRRLRREALITLSTLGPAAAELVPQIERIAASDDAELAEVARAALRAVRGR